MVLSNDAEYAYDDGYSLGYECGYDTGYDEGFRVGYEQALRDHRELSNFNLLNDKETA